MKVLQQILDKAGLAPIYRFKVPSKSEPKKFHIIEVFKDGHSECDCVASSYNQPCRHIKIGRHIKIVRNHLDKCQLQKKKESTETKD